MMDIKAPKTPGVIEVPAEHNNTLMAVGGTVVGVLSYKALKSYLDDGTRSTIMVEALSVAGSLAVATLSVLLMKNFSKKG